LPPDWQSFRLNPDGAALCRRTDAEFALHDLIEKEPIKTARSTNVLRLTETQRAVQGSCASPLTIKFRSTVQTMRSCSWRALALTPQSVDGKNFASSLLGGNRWPFTRQPLKDTIKA
jgi:hypothetical protein